MDNDEHAKRLTQHTLTLTDLISHESSHFLMISTTLGSARVYYRCSLGFAGQLTTVLPTSRTYLYCMDTKTFTIEREIRRSGNGILRNTSQTLGVQVYHSDNMSPWYRHTTVEPEWVSFVIGCNQSRFDVIRRQPGSIIDARERRSSPM